MIKDDTRQTIKFVAWVIAIIIAVYIAAVIIVFMAGSPSRKNDRQISQVASQKTPIKNIQQYYHLNRGTDSYALKGTAKKGQVYYFIYLPNSKKAYLLPSRKGVGENEIRSKFNQQHGQQKISNVNLGWYKGQAVWEVTSQNSQGNYSYTLYKFKNGSKISEVANL